MAILTDFLDFVEYSTRVEYSDGHEKKKIESYNRSKSRQKIRVNWIISFENIDGGYPQ